MLRVGEQRQAGLETPHQAGWEDAGRDAKPEQAERDFSLVSQEHTGVPVLCLLAGSRCLPPHPPSSPSQPQGWWDSPGIAVVGSGRFACVRVLFALLG